MNKEELESKCAIAMIISYKENSEVENIKKELAKKSVKRAIELGYEINIVHKNLSSNILNCFEKFGANIYNQKKEGFGNGLRQAIDITMNSKKDFIILAEPEKIDYINKINSGVKLLSKGYDLVVPRRNSFETYPPFQQLTEQIINKFWLDLTGLELDISFGPRSFSKNIANYFLEYKGDYGDKWDALNIPLLNAVLDENKVTSIDINYSHSSEQTRLEISNIEYNNKRISQLNNITNALYEHFKNRCLNHNNT